MDITQISEIAVSWAIEVVPNLVIAILIYLIGKWLARKITNIMAALMAKKNMDVTLIHFLEGLVYYALLIMVIIATVSQLGINTTSFLAIVGAAGLAIGLALKDSLSNFASGVMLIMFRPFKVGDYVTAGGVSGTVKQISIFNTLLSTPDNKEIIVPNGCITSDIITNASAHATRRIDLEIGIGYDDDIVKTKKVLETILKNHDKVLDDPAPLIAVKELGDNAVILVARPWVNAADYWTVYFDLTENIKLSFDKLGISFPYPQRDVHMYQEQVQKTGT